MHEDRPREGQHPGGTEGGTAPASRRGCTGENFGPRESRPARGHCAGARLVHGGRTADARLVHRLSHRRRSPEPSRRGFTGDKFVTEGEPTDQPTRENSAGAQPMHGGRTADTRLVHRLSHRVSHRRRSPELRRASPPPLPEDYPATRPADLPSRRRGWHAQGRARQPTPTHPLLYLRKIPPSATPGHKTLPAEGQNGPNLKLLQ